MKRIYTRTGDRGTTGIHGGERVEKDDIRIEANGTIDELNAVIGIIRSLLPQEHDWQKLLHHLQRELMVVMSHVATPSAIRDKNPNVLSPGLAAFCEQEMDTMTAGLKENGYFLLPGGTPVSAQLQFARTVAPPCRAAALDLESARCCSGRYSELYQSSVRSVFCNGTLRHATTGLAGGTLAGLCI